MKTLDSCTVGAQSKLRPKLAKRLFDHWTTPARCLWLYSGINFPYSGFSHSRARSRGVCGTV